MRLSSLQLWFKSMPGVLSGQEMGLTRGLKRLPDPNVKIRAGTTVSDWRWEISQIVHGALRRFCV